jgi:hypothetical protein
MINILLLQYRRRHFLPLMLNIFGGCRFKDFHITLCCIEEEEGSFAGIVEYGKALDLSISTLASPPGNDNYMWKIRKASRMDFSYTVKLDEDIFLSSSTWDEYFNLIIENLDNKENLLLTPAISNGIPTIDYFIKYNFDRQQSDDIIKLMSMTHIPNLWGADYTKLNDLLESTGYHQESFYREVSDVQHYYKGIHPVRINKIVHDYLNRTIISNIDKFFEERTLLVEEMWQPYLCNSVFAIRTDEYKVVVDDPSLFKDNFEEVAINLYREKTDKKILICVNSFGIHTAYNTWDLSTEENELVDMLSIKLKERQG